METVDQIKKLKEIESKVRGAVINLSVLNNYAEQVPKDVEILEQFKEDFVTSISEMIPVLEEVFFEDVDDLIHSLEQNEVM
ncbi:hypothetical protein [uncultured Gemella sp.]|jgi:hypothetical protein|uniref:hypothetical protein n=1 Tax=uncultured Gemella sp. TaxID=254352 RepID=UPI0028D0D553|nr:hypothetical protein [uncultured Gemella sp.]